MAKSKVLSIDAVIEILQKHKAEGETKITLYGYIADEENDYNLIVSDKEAFTEQSFAEWQLERNGY